MKTRIVCIILFLSFSFNSFSQEYDYTFCLGKIKLVLKAGGSATQSLMNSNGGIQSFVSGNYDKYNEGAPTEIIKINFKGTEYRYDLIKNGQGIPSMIIDAQGRKYPLCKYEKSKDDALDRMLVEDKIKEAEDKRMQKILQPKINFFMQEAKKISLLIDNPQKRSSVPRLLSQLYDKTDSYLTKYFTKAQDAWYDLFFKKVEVIKNENIEKTGDAYGEDKAWNLQKYFSMDNTKNILPNPDSCLFEYEIKPKRSNFMETITTRGYDSDLGYVINRELFNRFDQKIATITQDEDYYILKLNGSRTDSYKNNIDLIKITKSGGGVDQKMEIEYASSTDKFMLSQLYQKYGGMDEEKKYKLKYVSKNVNRGCPLVGALHQLNRSLR
jgi:hypothetical protein